MNSEENIVAAVGGDVAHGESGKERLLSAKHEFQPYPSRADPVAAATAAVSHRCSLAPSNMHVDVADVAAAAAAAAVAAAVVSWRE